MTHTTVASREGSLNPQLPGRWATQRKTTTWQLKWVPTFGYGTSTAISGQAASHF